MYCEIDHDIAKCLATLDRQGLKFLKETLKPGKNSVTNSEGDTAPSKSDDKMKQIISEWENYRRCEVDPMPLLLIEEKAQKEIPLKLSKKVSIKKHSTETKLNSINKQGLEEELHQKMKEMKVNDCQYKTKNELKKDKKDKKDKSKHVSDKCSKYEPSTAVGETASNEIKEEIECEGYEEIEEELPCEIVDDGEKHQFILLYYVCPKDNSNEKEYNSYQSVQANNISSKFKPFFKELLRKYGEESSKYANDLHIENPMKESSVSEIEASKSVMIASESKPYEYNQPTRVKDNIELASHDCVSEYQSVYPRYITMDKIVKMAERIKYLSSEYQNYVYYFLDQLYRRKNDTHNFPPVKLHNDKKSGDVYKTIMENSLNKSGSRSKLRHEKASTIHSLIELKKPRIYGSRRIYLPVEERRPELPLQKEEICLEYGMNNIDLSEYSQVKPAKPSFLKEKSLSNIPIYLSLPTYTPNTLGLSSAKKLSSPVFEVTDGSKLISVKKKVINVLSLKILSNNGHPSLVGLKAIYVFSVEGIPIVIDKNNFKQYNPRLLKLFTRNPVEQNEPYMWISPLKKAYITIYNISNQIGGIKVTNYDKSDLYSTKEAVYAYVWLNGILSWSGRLKSIRYEPATEIKLLEDFKFPIMSSTSINIDYQKILSKCWLYKLDADLDLGKYAVDDPYPYVKSRTMSRRRNSNARVDEYSTNISRYICQEDNTIKKSIKCPTETRKDTKVNNLSATKHEKDILGLLNESKQMKSSIKIDSKNKETLNDAEADAEFNKIMSGLYLGNKWKQGNSYTRTAEKKEKKKYGELQGAVEGHNSNKYRNYGKMNLEYFMKDSLFCDNSNVQPYRQQSQVYKQLFSSKVSKQPKYVANPNREKANSALGRLDLDNLISELYDVVGKYSVETGEYFKIPYLPRGKTLQMTLISNWGHVSFIGLNGLYFLDEFGNNIKPIGIECNGNVTNYAIDKLCHNPLLTTDYNHQLKMSKGKKIILKIIFQSSITLSLIRIWNYNGHRVRTSIGVKKCEFRLDNIPIFAGEIRPGTGCCENSHRCCEYILFTNDANIIDKINEKDWLAGMYSKAYKDYNKIFRETLSHFNRPKTGESECKHSINADKIIVKPNNENPIQYRLPKRNCSEYDVLELPSGYNIKIVLHSSWGDRFFIGLNGIQFYDYNGEIIPNTEISQVWAEPSHVGILPGYEGDKRIVNNLFNGVNINVSDKDIWLAPLQLDVYKAENRLSNIFVVSFIKAKVLSGINFYNYSKTPQRGVHELYILFDRLILYRGYLRRFEATGDNFTTINFAKDAKLIEKMNYCGYNYDTFEQCVGLVNEKKVVRQRNGFEVAGDRPKTGRLQEEC